MNTFVVSVCPLDPESSDFGDVCALYAPFLHQLTMQSSLFERGCPVLVVVCVVRKLRPCPSYSRRRDRINLGLIWDFGVAYTRGGGYLPGTCIAFFFPLLCLESQDLSPQLSVPPGVHLCAVVLRRGWTPPPPGWTDDLISPFL